MSVWKRIAYVAALLSVGVGGWFARGRSESDRCSYMAGDYERLPGGLRALIKLDPYPLDRVSEQVLKNIQQCWAAHPFAGPMHVMQLADARTTKGGDYYVVFDPWEVTDVRLAFLVNGKGDVLKAYHYSTM